MEYSVDIFINAENSRWTGIVREHPDGGGQGEIVYEKHNFLNEPFAEIACDNAINKRKAVLCVII